MTEFLTKGKEGPTAHGDAGSTLVELILAIGLMAIIVVPLITAVSVSVTASSSGRAAANVETALVNAADRVNRAPQRCDYTIYAQAAVQTQGWPPGQAVVAHEFFEPAATPDLPGTWHAGGCPSTTRPNLLLQRLTISVTSPDGRVAREIEVVKSEV